MPESFVITPEMEKMMDKVMARYGPVVSKEDPYVMLRRECICCKIIKWAHKW